MSEMVERVKDQFYGTTLWLGDEEEARAMARQIIAAMHEPTEAMKSAWERECMAVDVEEGWRIGIDEALK